MAAYETPRKKIDGSTGFFLVLDGPDGGGKSTQLARLASTLRAKGFEVVTCRDPGGTSLGDRLRSILLDRDTVGLSLRAEMLLYMASRAQLVADVIRPALESGKVVISDRYLLANIVYQGEAGGLGVDAVGLVGREATGGLLPDLTLILDLPSDLARARVGAARDRMEDRPIEYHRRVRDGFLEAAARAAAGDCGYYPAMVRVIDASGDLNTVAHRIESEVGHVLAFDPRR